MKLHGFAQERFPKDEFGIDCISDNSLIKIGSIVGEDRVNQEI